jgi:predicted permease
MRWLRFFRRKPADIELRAQIDVHLPEEMARNEARGMPAPEVQHQTRLRLGNAQRARENVWQQNTVSGLDKLGRDLKYAVRTLVHTPGFSIIAIIVIALCIGAATSLFTIVRSVLLRPLPFRDSEQLVMVYEHFRAPSINRQEFNYNVVAPADYYDWRAQTHGFDDMAIWRRSQFNLTGEHGELPEVITAGSGAWNLFPLLGVQPAFGRTFAEAEDHPGSNVVMLTWSVFQRRFAGDPTIVGRQIHLDSKPYTVVGVLPGFFTYPDAKIQVWVPYAAAANPEVLHHHDWHQSHVVARMRSGVSLANAMSQVEAVQYRLHLRYLTAPVAEDVVSRTLIDDLAKDVKKPLVILMCAVACVLLIGCLNVANLLVARGAARQKEIAIRGALGAQRFTLVREQLMESLLICFAGGTGGVLLSLLATNYLVRAWKDLPSAQNIKVDGAVLAFACALVFVAALLAGLLPALSSTGKTVLAALQASSRTAGSNASRTALRKILLTVEITATVVLLIAAGLLLKSFLRLRTTDVGCATDNVLTMSYSLPEKKYDKPAKVNAFNEALLERLRAMPGVRGVALGSELPAAGYGGDDVFDIPEHPAIRPGEELPDALYRTADPGYFKALQIPLLSGRYFTRQDRLDQANKVIISRQLAQQYFAGEDPIGKHLHVSARNNTSYEIIGVVGDTLWRVDQPKKPAMYFPILEGRNLDGMALAVRTASDPLAFSVPVQKQVAALDPELPVSDVLSMQQVIGESLVNASFSASLVLAFAVLSLVLASVGLYGVLSYLMTQRTPELGIRIALGARREQVLRLMLLDGLRPALFGLGLGIVASAVTTRIVQSMLYGTKPLDPPVFVGVAITLLLVAVLACMVPAWRASHLDPVQALRTE